MLGLKQKETDSLTTVCFFLVDPVGIYPRSKKTSTGSLFAVSADLFDPFHQYTKQKNTTLRMVLFLWWTRWGSNP